MRSDLAWFSQYAIELRSVEEVADWLSSSEGRKVTPQEVRRIERLALYKLRMLLQRLDVVFDDLV